MTNGKFQELDEVFEEIKRNIISSIRSREIFYAYNSCDSIPIKFNGTTKAHVLNQLMAALCESLILSIFRCWETGRKSGNRSFPRAKILLSDPEFQAKILTEEDGGNRLNLLNIFSNRVELFYKSNRNLIIKYARHEGIAHSIENAQDRVDKKISDRVKMLHLFQTLKFNEHMFMHLSVIWKNQTYMLSPFKDDVQRASTEFIEALPSFSYTEIDSEYLSYRSKFAQ